MTSRAIFFLLFAGVLAVCGEQQGIADQVDDAADVAHEETARLLSENYMRAATAQNAGDYSTAEKWHRTNLTLIEFTPGMPPEMRVQGRFNLASAVMYQDRLDEAESILEEAQNVTDAFPQIDPTIKAHLLGNWATLKAKQQDFETAEDMHEESLAILEATTGLSDEATASLQVELARTQVQLGKYKKAEGNYRHALRVFTDLGYDESTPYVAAAMDEYEVLRERLDIE